MRSPAGSPHRDDALRRLEQELTLIEHHRLSGFFLVYHDLFDLAREVAADVRSGSRRARGSRMEFVIQGQPKKLESYKAILVRAGVTDEEVAYVGDDLPDLPILQRAGLAVAVGDAVVEVKRAAHYVTTVKGGEGAIREVVELILKAQGKWKKAIPQAIA